MTTAPDPLTPLQAAARRLTAGLRGLASEGHRTPCQQSRHGDLWFSDDRAERLRAMMLCRACPVRQLCYEYREALDAAPRRRGVNQHLPAYAPGVWGGVDYTRTYSSTRRVDHPPAA